MGSHLPHRVQSHPQSRLQRRREQPSGPWTKPHGPMDHIITSAAPAVTAAETVAPTLKSEPASRCGGRGVGANPGRGGGGTEGGGTGDKERLIAILYNNAYVEGRWGLFRNAGAM